MVTWCFYPSCKALCGLRDRDASSCSNAAACPVTLSTETGEAQVFSPAGFLLGKSGRESLVSPSFLRNHLQRGTVHGQEAPAERAPAGFSDSE